MTSFSSRKIENPLNLGEKLRQTRQEKNLSIKEVSAKINISARYLEAIESGNFKELPGEVYAKNFLKAYTKFLDLNTEEFIALFKSEHTIYNKTKGKAVNDFKKPVAKVSKMSMIVTPKVFKGIIIGMLALVVLGYLGAKVKAIITPPFLVVTSPSDDIVITENFIEIAGNSQSDVTLEINGQQVLANANGDFAETIDLQFGANVIEVKATKRHGKATKVYRQIVVIDETENIGEESN